MLNPDKNTPSDAYELAFGVLIRTCRPTLYLFLSYFGVSQTARAVVSEQHVGPRSQLDFAVFGTCLLVAFVMAQVLEYYTRPLRGPDLEHSVRRDRAARICNVLLSLAGVTTTLLTGGAVWGAHLFIVCFIAVCTAVGEVLYQSYGRSHPYRPEPTSHGIASQVTAA
ncbi:hypothetical protein [Micromonospora sp. NPDC049301]|uniref:hypothetical protein n=1 Tax=Micromonospora sp. NPDC049301 TaxID=3155723 RepID=UPI003444A632